MTLGELVDRVTSLVAIEPAPIAASWRERPVSSIEYDSRQVIPGSVFVALRGEHVDGMAFAQQAIVKGACAIVAADAPPEGWSAPWLRAANARTALAALAAVYYGHPSDDLLVVGVTGTNGKTTTTYLAASVLEAAGVKCGRLGTVSYDIGGIERNAPRTTPEASDLQRMLREMVANGCGACAAEVSSHALALNRVDFMHFAAAVFTNLTRDHLDFHGDMASYFAAKRRLFDQLPAGAISALNVDDSYGAQLAGALKRKVTYGIDQPADVRAGPFTPSLEGLQFEILTPHGVFDVRSTLPGRPNVYNILAAAALAVGLELPQRAIQEGIARISHVPGRFQRVSTGKDDVGVIVDYAHTDDALKNVLETLRPMVRGNLITVFGCGGDRDRTKRPLMGAVAARLSDLVMLTSDNPRSEDPAAIIEEIKRGIVPPGDRPAVHQGQVLPRLPVTPHLTIVDREEAIRRAVGDAKPGDVVLIAGKGHEKYQVVGDRTRPFDDVQVAEAALAGRRGDRRAS
jgi:UDP-N-acetylmuramoyl-L-alanyl-D-glutamate--2,6-diaminopimelate ligase